MWTNGTVLHTGRDVYTRAPHLLEGLMCHLMLPALLPWCHGTEIAEVGSAGALNHHSLLKYWKTFRFRNGTQTVNISVFSMQVTYLSSKCILVFPTSIAGNHFCWVNKYRYRKLLYNISLRNVATLFSNKICTTKIAQMFYVTSCLI